MADIISMVGIISVAVGFHFKPYYWFSLLTKRQKSERAVECLKLKNMLRTRFTLQFNKNFINMLIF